MFVAACSGGVTPRPAIETVPIREGIDATLAGDAGTSAASSSEPESPEPTPAKKSPSKPAPKAAPKKPPPKKGR